MHNSVMFLLPVENITLKSDSTKFFIEIRTLWCSYMHHMRSFSSTILSILYIIRGMDGHFNDEIVIYSAIYCS